MKRALILVEGQTEERFVQDILREHFWNLNLDLAPTLLVTKHVKDGPNFKGGITNFAKFENDMRRLLRSAGDALVTTLIDYDGLPMEFPGMATRPATGPIERVTHIERAVATHFGSPPSLVPYLSLHEFEALLFASPDELPRAMTESEKQKQFAQVREAYETPEYIDENNYPSYRILSLFPTYRKALHGPITAKRIGMTRIRTECPHFNHWISELEDFARR